MLAEVFHSINDKLLCDYCGRQEFYGNSAGYYWADIVFPAKGADPKVCCSLNDCPNSPGKMWEYNDQLHGQYKPLSIPEDAPLSWQMVFRRWFNGSTRFAIMKYAKVDFEVFKKVCQPSSYEGGSFKDGYNYYNGDRLIYTSEFRKDEKSIVLALTNADIINTINEMLSAMRFVQLKLF